MSAVLDKSKPRDNASNEGTEAMQDQVHSVSSAPIQLLRRPHEQNEIPNIPDHCTRSENISNK